SMCSFSCESPGRPLLFFSKPGIKHTTTMLLSDDGCTLFIGAQDVLLSLDVSQPNGVTDRQCLLDYNCPNFVRVLLPINSTHLYACGTFAYNPHDSYIVRLQFSSCLMPFIGQIGRCPFNPYQRNTAIVVGGELFTGTTHDFLGRTPIISRHLSKDGRPDVSQDTSVTLDDPIFVSSASDPSEGKVYFFFSEASEHRFLDDFRVSRVAQVCKDDIGGKRILQKRWTSFAKAELLCKPPKELPFNIIEDVFTFAPSEGDSTQDIFFYGVFTSQWALASGQSAVCIFHLRDIKDVFTGNYKIFKENQWSDRIDKKSNIGKCGLDNASDTTLMAVRESFLASRSVRPRGGVPVIISPNQRYSRVAALQTQAANGQVYNILFLLSESGFLHKVVLLEKGPHIIEEVQVFRQPQLVKNIILSNSKGVLFVGTSEGVTQVPVSQCNSYKSCAQCVLARDPLCGWDPASGRCARVSATSDSVWQDVEHGTAEKTCQGSLPVAPRCVTHKCFYALILSPVEVYTDLNEVVKLKCSKTSNLATLYWKSSKASPLPKHLFFTSRDEGLVFLATPDTLGIYHCVSVEQGYEEIATIYYVRQRVSPRIIDTQSAEVRTTTTIQRTTEAKDQMTTIKISQSSDTQTITENLEDMVNRSEAQTAKSYHSELVAVSFLLSLCVCLLGLGLFWWSQQGKWKCVPQDIPEGANSAENEPMK
uniref:Sema domain-containing protein n=1 Tax=Esox lucius TaxID=8010 RepID=A0A3P8XQN7_ESOLU